MSHALVDTVCSMGLTVCERIIRAYGDTPAPSTAADARLTESVGDSVPQLLAQLVRRGLQPAVVQRLRNAWANRPLERSLLAWDVLNGALLPAGSFVEELRADASAAASVLPKPGHAYAEPKPEAIERVVAAAASARCDVTGDPDPPIQLLRDPSITADAKLFELIREYARLLHRAHLPTLASFRLADLYFHHGYERALPDLVEVLLDQEAGDVDGLVARVSSAGPESVELATYARVRGFNNREEWDQALAFADEHRSVFEALKMPPQKAAQLNARPTLAYAEAALRNGKKTVPYEHVVAIAGSDAAWRYAFRIMINYAATRIKDAQFVKLLASYLERFGNDLHVWYDSLAVAPDDVHWGPSFTATLAHEAQSLPHEPAVWRSAALLMGDDDASDGVDEVDARIRAQATIR